MTVIVGLILLLLFVVTVGKIAGRLLGIRLGPVRGMIVGLLGWIVGVVVAAATIGENTSHGYVLIVDSFAGWIAFVAVITFFGVLAAMPIAIALDLLTRRTSDAPHGKRRRRFLHPVRSVRSALAPYGRLREVVGHARRANLLRLRYASRSALESPDMSRRLRTVFEESGGMLVKFGQIASTRTDILPEALTTELANLRADVRPVPADAVRKVLEDELGEPVENAFKSFEWEPLAAASIGQTHRAVLLDGTRVVVKVQRPGIAEVVARDAGVVRLATRQLERRVEAARSVGLRALGEELISGIIDELDYLREASLGTRLRERRKADVGIAVPRVYPTLTTRRVLVMEEVVGKSIDHAQALADSPVSRPELARRILSSFLGQILQDGMFHADPHPGNLFIDADGTIWMLDFGSVGRLDALALEGLRGIALGVATNDPAVLARAARDLAGSDDVVDLRALEADLSAQLSHMDAHGVDPRLIGQVLTVMQRHEMRPPASITLLARALLTLEGTLKILDPEFDLAVQSSEIVSGERKDMFGTPQELIQRELLRTLPSLRTLPDHMETLANQLRAGRLTVRTEHYGGADQQVVDRWVDRAVLAAIGGFGAIASAVVLFAASVTTNKDVQTTLWILGFSGMACATVLLMRSAARALRRYSARLD